MSGTPAVTYYQSEDEANTKHGTTEGKKNQNSWWCCWAAVSPPLETALALDSSYVGEHAHLIQISATCAWNHPNTEEKEAKEKEEKRKKTKHKKGIRKKGFGEENKEKE